MSHRFRLTAITAACVFSVCAPISAGDARRVHDGIELIDTRNAKTAPAPLEATATECFTLNNTCEVPYYVWSLPSPDSLSNPARIRMAEGFQPDPFFLRDCTLKAAWVAVYDWIDRLHKDDLEVSIWSDDGAGLPGVKLTSDTLPAAVVDANLSWLRVDFTDNAGGAPTAPPGGRPHVVIEAPWSAPGVGGVYILSDGGTDDAAVCPKGAANSNGSIFYADVGYWESHADHFGGFQFGTFIKIEVCCAPHGDWFCAPGWDPTWETQGNGIGRTNATRATLSNPCALTVLWSREPGGDIQAIQPIIAGSFVLVTATDSLHCFDRTSGNPVWTPAFGGFPYIVGDVRGPATVDLDEPGPGGLGVVYVGGADARSFSKLDLATGAVIWSRNVLVIDPPNLPLATGATAYSGSILSGGFVYFTQESGNVYKLDAATGIDAAGSPLMLPDVGDGKVPFNALTSDGTKLWTGDADVIATNGSIYQIDMATFSIDWQLANPSYIFTGDIDYYEPEGFPGSLAYEDGRLYYHSLIRDDGDFGPFPQSGALGCIDITVENGSGSGVLWVNDVSTGPLAAPGTVPSSFNYSGPVVGNDFVFTTARGYYSGTTEPDGVAAYSKTLGQRVWYHGYTDLGNEGGVRVLDDVRCDAPATAFCGPDLTQYLFTGHVDGFWRLFRGNLGLPVWRRQFTGRQRGTALVDDAVATVTRSGGPLTGGGSLTYFVVDTDRPRLQIDSQYVFRGTTPGSGAVTDVITGAIRNAGCVTLNIASYTPVNPLAVRVSSINPVLSRAAERSTHSLGGYDALLSAADPKELAIARTAIDDRDGAEPLARRFARKARATADPLFLSVATGPSTLAPGAFGDITITYDETGLAENAGHTNYIEIASDDPDFFPQGAVEAVPGVTTPGTPVITVSLFNGCLDEDALMTIGRGTMWITNWGAESGGGNFAQPDATDGLITDGNSANHFDGGLYMAVNDDAHWAFEGCSVGGYPRRAGEWGPTAPCGPVTIGSNSFPSPFDASPQSYAEVTFRMIDLASAGGFFPPATRQCGGVTLDIKRVGPQAAEFGNFVLMELVITNDSGAPGDIPGILDSIWFGIAADWDVGAFTDNYMYKTADGYAIFDGGAADGHAAGWACGHVRLDADHHAVGAMGSGSAPIFMMGDIQNDQGHGNAAAHIMDDPQAWADSVGVTSTFNTDIGAYWTAAKIFGLEDDSSEVVYIAIYQIHNDGVHESWSDAAEFEAAVAHVMGQARAYAGFGAGDVNCDGDIDLADVVRLGNILDGLFNPTGTGGEFSGDCDGDGDIDEDDYELLYDVVASVQPIDALVSGWRF